MFENGNEGLDGQGGEKGHMSGMDPTARASPSAEGLGCTVNLFNGNGGESWDRGEGGPWAF